MKRPNAPSTPPAKRSAARVRQTVQPTPNRVVREEQKRLSRIRASKSRQASETALFTRYRRHRRAIAISVITPVVLLVGLVIATLTTPMLAVEKITVKGTDRLSKSQVLNALKAQVGTPLTLIDSAAIGKALRTFVLVESYAVIARPPHELLVRITERQPISTVEVNGVAYLYDPAGVRIGIAKSGDDLPLVKIHGEPGTSSHYAAAIDVLLALPAELLPRVSVVEARTKDDVRMQLRGAARQQIIWGDSSDSVLKSKVLKSLVRHVRESSTATIDVSSPTAPVVRYGNF